ncbi:hypothetical protein Tco_1515691 [Tanacetum coccineum]
MPSSPSSPHRHHHLLVIIPTPPLSSSPPRTITSTHAKHHHDNLLEDASSGGNSTEGAFVSRVTATKGVREYVWLSGLAVKTAGEGCRVGFVTKKVRLGGSRHRGCRVGCGTAGGRDVGFGSQTQGVRWCVGSPPKAATGGVGLAVGQPGIAGGRDIGFGAAGT